MSDLDKNIINLNLLVDEKEKEIDIISVHHNKSIK